MAKLDTKVGGKAIRLRSNCPINAVLEIFGDKWTLLIVRDIMINDKHKYNEFVGMVEGIPSNILADRLRRLVDFDILDKIPYQDNPIRYEYHLTPSGLKLKPVLDEIIRWGVDHVPGTGPRYGFSIGSNP